MSFIPPLHFAFNCKKCRCRQGPINCCSTVNYGTWQQREVRYDESNNQLCDHSPRSRTDRIGQALNKESAAKARTENIRSFEAIELYFLNHYGVLISNAADEAEIDLRPFILGKRCIKMREHQALTKAAESIQPEDVDSLDSLSFLFMAKYGLDIDAVALSAGINIHTKQKIMLPEFQRLKRAAEKMASDPTRLLGSTHSSAASEAEKVSKLSPLPPTLNFSEPKKKKS